jgi:hypothetical protein
MVSETAAAAIASEGASGGLGAVSAAGVAIKAFVLSNPMSLAGIAGVVVGVLGYHFLFDHGEEAEADQEVKEGGVDIDTTEPSAA